MRLSRPMILGGGALCLAAAWIGLSAGMRALPPSESAIIEAGAAAYIAQTGGQPTDCLARPVAAGPAYLVVICEEPDYVWQRSYDRFGRPVEIGVSGAPAGPGT